MSYVNPARNQRKLRARSQSHSALEVYPTNKGRRSLVVCSASGLVLLCLLLAACSSPFGGGSNTGTVGGATPTATSANVPLAQVHWCAKPSLLFRDEGAPPSNTPTTTTTTATPGATATASGTATVTATTSATPATTTTPAGVGTPTTITSWEQVKANLGFNVYLPATLPTNSCLVSAQATIHDPTFGGSFLIGYLLPDHTAITISEAPLSSRNTTFQCNVSNSSTAQAATGQSGSAGTPQATASPTALPLQLCSGAQTTTNVVLSARRSVEYLQQFFSSLRTDVTWIPTA